MKKYKKHIVTNCFVFVVTPMFKSILNQVGGLIILKINLSF